LGVAPRSDRHGEIGASTIWLAPIPCHGKVIDLRINLSQHMCAAGSAADRRHGDSVERGRRLGRLADKQQDSRHGHRAERGRALGRQASRQQDGWRRESAERGKRASRVEGIPPRMIDCVCGSGIHRLSSLLCNLQAYDPTHKSSVLTIGVIAQPPSIAQSPDLLGLAIDQSHNCSVGRSVGRPTVLGHSIPPSMCSGCCLSLLSLLGILSSG
jgi:hypothetical protein